MNKKLISRRLILVAWLATLTATLLVAQPAIKGLERVPVDLRTSLMLRVGHLAESYRTQDWSAVYANLSQQSSGHESLDQFRMRVAGAYPRNIGKSIVKFVPENLVEQPAGQWAVWGCATIQGKEKRQNRERWIVMASWERDGWYFSELLPAAQLDAKKPLPCSTK